jgi:hypothetical protein
MKKALHPLFLALLLLLPSCTTKEIVFRTDLTAEEISSQCGSVISSIDLLSQADEDYIQYRMLLDEITTKSCAVYIQNAGTSIDEYGIIQANGEDPTAVASLIQDYLLRRNEEWTGQYLVEEYPKLESAEYKVFGSYVVYAILSEGDKTLFFNAVEQCLTEN